MKIIAKTFLLPIILVMWYGSYGQTLTFKIVDTGQKTCYDTIIPIDPPAEGQPFYGQDAQFEGFQPSYQDHGDGTVTDLVTGLMWQKNLFSGKLTFNEAVAGADTFSLAGYSDWRLPTIKELYSLILFSGTDPSGPDPVNLTPFLDTNYFEFRYGDTTSGERIIDAQYASRTEYAGTTMMGDHTDFGVNFADGRIKGYGTGPMPGQTEDKKFEVRYVRGNTQYGMNDFTDQGDGTIMDHATGLIWDKNDSGEGMNWEAALAWVYQKNQENYLGYNDWRLPDAKELQSIVDYSRCLQTTGSAAIDPLFNCTSITDEGGNTNYPFFWAGTTHVTSNGFGNFGVYVCFGEALGWMEVPPNSGNYTLMDVHGAGAQRSDFKDGDPAAYPYGHGPQGDVVRIFNFVRLVRSDSTIGINEPEKQRSECIIFPDPAHDKLTITFRGKAMTSGMIRIFNLLGEMVYSTPASGLTGIVCDICNFPEGMYLVMIEGDTSLLMTRFIKI